MKKIFIIFSVGVICLFSFNVSAQIDFDYYDTLCYEYSEESVQTDGVIFEPRHIVPNETLAELNSLVIPFNGNIIGWASEAIQEMDEEVKYLVTFFSKIDMPQVLLTSVEYTSFASTYGNSWIFRFNKIFICANTESNTTGYHEYFMRLFPGLTTVEVSSSGTVEEGNILYTVQLIYADVAIPPITLDQETYDTMVEYIIYIGNDFLTFPKEETPPEYEPTPDNFHDSGATPEVDLPVVDPDVNLPETDPQVDLPEVDPDVNLPVVDPQVDLPMDRDLEENLPNHNPDADPVVNLPNVDPEVVLPNVEPEVNLPNPQSPAGTEPPNRIEPPA